MFMADSEQTLVTYLDLACASQRRQRLSESDKLMVLAAVVATRLSWPQVADACRQQILAHNPRHLVRHWPSVEAALATERFRAYLKQVERRYPPERAEYMLGCLGQRPIVAGTSAQEMANSLLAKLARQQAAADQAALRTKPSGQQAMPRAADDHGQSSRNQTRRGRRAKLGGRRRAIRSSGLSTAKRLLATMPKQQFVWWPYWVGLALLALATAVWAARRLG
jgi:hypothetical protein